MSVCRENIATLRGTGGSSTEPGVPRRDQETWQVYNNWRELECIRVHSRVGHRNRPRTCFLFIVNRFRNSARCLKIFVCGCRLNKVAVTLMIFPLHCISNVEKMKLCLTIFPRLNHEVSFPCSKNLNLVFWQKSFYKDAILESTSAGHIDRWH